MTDKRQSTPDAELRMAKHTAETIDRINDYIFGSLDRAKEQRRVTRKLKGQLRKNVEANIGLATELAQQAFRERNKTDAQRYGVLATAFEAILDDLEDV